MFTTFGGDIHIRGKQGQPTLNSLVNIVLQAVGGNALPQAPQRLPLELGSVMHDGSFKYDLSTLLRTGEANFTGNAIVDGNQLLGPVQGLFQVLYYIGEYAVQFDKAVSAYLPGSPIARFNATVANAPVVTVQATQIVVGVTSDSADFRTAFASAVMSLLPTGSTVTIVSVTLLTKAVSVVYTVHSTASASTLTTSLSTGTATMTAVLQQSYPAVTVVAPTLVITNPTAAPTGAPSAPSIPKPSFSPSVGPTMQPSSRPSHRPSHKPSRQPIVQPIMQPSNRPSHKPSGHPYPTSQPSQQPNSCPSLQPSVQPTTNPTTSMPTTPLITMVPTIKPSSIPSYAPTNAPSNAPSLAPSSAPSVKPTFVPTIAPTLSEASLLTIKLQNYLSSNLTQNSSASSHSSLSVLYQEVVARGAMPAVGGCSNWKVSTGSALSTTLLTQIAQSVSMFVYNDNRSVFITFC